MTEEIQATYIRQLLEAHRHESEVVIAWQGGEPTIMGIEFFRRSIELERQYAAPGQRVLNTLQTNGTLLDEQWAVFLKQERFLVGISIDGPPELHDRYRVDKGGKPTFERVLRGLNYLKAHKVDWNVLACVHAANADHGRRVYCFLRDELGAQFIQFIPVVEHEVRRPHVGGISAKPGRQHPGIAGRHSVQPGHYGRFLIDVFEEWVRRDVGRVYVQMFDTALAHWAGLPGGLCVHEPTCGRQVALEHTGDLYACDHFVEPRFLIGNIQHSHLRELVDSAPQQQFGLEKRDSLTRACLECDVLFACNGGCPKDRFAVSPHGEPGHNYLCPSYKAFFHHIDRPMQVMANLLGSQGPPSEVMRVYRAEDARRTRSEACTCGSGRGWTHCHGSPIQMRRAVQMPVGTPSSPSLRSHVAEPIE